jgi:hypothetical protein
VCTKLTEAIASAVDRPQLQSLLEERALAHDAMDASRVARVREEMERAEARRLQPHYIESFFLAAFTQLGGTTRQREARRYEVTHVPAPIRNRDRLIGVSSEYGEFFRSGQGSSPKSERSMKGSGGVAMSSTY